jgi:hypothetical protein
VDSRGETPGSCVNNLWKLLWKVTYFPFEYAD